MLNVESSWVMLHQTGRMLPFLIILELLKPPQFLTNFRRIASLNLPPLMWILQTLLALKILRYGQRPYHERVDVYERVHNFEEAIVYFKRVPLFFQDEDAAASAIQCKQKIAQISALLEHSSMRYGVRDYLLNARICHLCKRDLGTVTTALKRYQALDPGFSRTREYDLLTVNLGFLLTNYHFLYACSYKMLLLFTIFVNTRNIRDLTYSKTKWKQVESTEHAFICLLTNRS
ncbi:hypothetical protein Cgig2_016394 [Carnegiea gigantea]|uniref:Uncharacterized protein n=1 Tax=Carnegiea gigantea TaxID=171969 RepID=A0A9Q1K958_9CARY|nr:hypothetical protein Cgig2_016394 [Carnegiea gigantea]